MGSECSAIFFITNTAIIVRSSFHSNFHLLRFALFYNWSRGRHNFSSCVFPLFVQCFEPFQVPCRPVAFAASAVRSVALDPVGRGRGYSLEKVYTVSIWWHIFHDENVLISKTSIMHLSFLCMIPFPPPPCLWCIKKRIQDLKHLQKGSWLQKCKARTGKMESSQVEEESHWSHLNLMIGYPLTRSIHFLIGLPRGFPAF